VGEKEKGGKKMLCAENVFRGNEPEKEKEEERKKN
jgi:hypothetical protein